MVDQLHWSGCGDTKAELLPKKAAKTASLETFEGTTFSYDANGEIRPLSPTEQLTCALEFLSTELDRRLFSAYLKDTDDTPLGPPPACILTIQSSGRCKGFAAKSVWSDNCGKYLDQITLVFDAHAHGDVKDLSATLAHEKMHAKQFHDGKPGTGNYHNRQFADWMKSIGIQTSKTGRPGGAEIGTGMSQYIVEHGPFDQIMDELIAEGFFFPWEAVGMMQSKDGGSVPPSKPRDRSKMKFTCPVCGQNAWAKQAAKLACLGPNCQHAPMRVVSA